jgi:hypothetical protein
MRISIEKGLEGIDLEFLRQSALTEPISRAYEINEKRFHGIQRELGNIECDVDQYQGKTTFHFVRANTNILESEA